MKHFKGWMAMLSASLIGLGVTVSGQGAGGTLVGGFDVGPGGAPGIYNALSATAGFTWFQLYFSPLVEYDVNFQKLQGELAKSWLASSDGLKYSFALRDNVKWHDGKPFTARDVKYTLELILNPDTGSVFLPRMADIASVTISGTSQVTVTMKRPNAAFLDVLANVPMMPQHLLGNVPPKEISKTDWWRTNPVGTGPFKWSKLVPDQYVELVANPDYWRGKPKLEKVINRYFKEAGSSVLALRSGDIQFTYLTADEAAALRGDANLNIIAGPSQVTNYVGFNNKDARFKDARVRQAFMYAIDRKSIVEQLYRGGAVIVPCQYNNPKYHPKGLEPYAYNPQKAKDLLKAAGWEQKEPIEFLTYYGDKLSADVMVSIQQMLGQIGVEVKVRAVDVPTYNQITNTDNTFSLVFAGAANGPDPDQIMPSFQSNAAPPNGPNRMRVNIPALDDLIQKGRSEVNPSKRVGAYQSMCKAVNSEMPWAPMWVAQRFGAVSKNVSGFVWTPAPGGGRFNDNAQDWDIK
jgi:peptide/nickel transport system substrate-binding protein